MGVVYAGRTPEIREILCGNYRIFYRFREEQRLAEILVVWHSARSEPNLSDRCEPYAIGLALTVGPCEEDEELLAVTD